MRWLDRVHRSSYYRAYQAVGAVGDLDRGEQNRLAHCWGALVVLVAVVGPLAPVCRCKLFGEGIEGRVIGCTAVEQVLGAAIAAPETVDSHFELSGCAYIVIVVVFATAVVRCLNLFEKIDKAVLEDLLGALVAAMVGSLEPGLAGFEYAVNGIVVVPAVVRCSNLVE